MFFLRMLAWKSWHS